MWLVAGIAGHAAGVRYGGHLREVLGFGGVFLVAAAAKVGHLGQFGSDGARVVGVFGQWTMAGFASDVGMFAGGAKLGLVVVAHDAGILPGVVDGVGADQVEGARTVVAVFAEVLRHDSGSNDEKDTHGGNQDQGRADRVSPFIKQSAQDGSLFRTVELLPRLSRRPSGPSAGTWAGRSNLRSKRPFYLELEQKGTIRGKCYRFRCGRVDPLG